MLNLLKILLQPKHVKIATSILDEIDHEMKISDFEPIKTNLQRAIMRNPNAFSSKSRNGISLRTCMLNLVVNTLRDEMISGRHHVYRGVLNTIGPAPNLMRAHAHVLGLLQISGEISDQDVKEITDELRHDISMAG